MSHLDLLDTLITRWADDDDMRVIEYAVNRSDEQLIGYDELRDIEQSLESVIDRLAPIEDELANGAELTGDEAYNLIVEIRESLKGILFEIPEGLTANPVMQDDITEPLARIIARHDNR